MIEIEEDNEKDYKFFKAFILLFESIVIGICVIFFIAIEKVDAAMICIGYNGNNEVFNTNNNGQGNIPSYTGALTYIKCYTTTYDIEGTNKTFTYGISIDIEYQTANPWTPNINYNLMGGYIDNVNSLSFHRTDKCYFNTYRQDNDTTVSLLNGKNRRLYGSMTCNEVEGRSTFTPPAFIIEFTSSGSNSSKNYKGNFNGHIATIAFDESTNQDEVISEIGQQTADLVNQINSQTNAIISNANDNTQNIIDNQNENTDRVREAIENQNRKCENYNYNNTQNMGETGNLNLQGNNGNNSSYHISEYTKVDVGKTYSLSYQGTAKETYYCLYDTNKNKLTCLGSEYKNGTYSITPSQNGYIRYNIRNASYVNFTGEYCYNLIEKQNENLQDIEDTLTDDSIPDVNIINGIPVQSDAPISDLLLIPIRLIQIYLGAVNGQCADYSFGELYGTEIKFKCSDINKIPTKLGSNLINKIDLIISIFAIYNIFMLFITAFDNFTSLRDSYETLAYNHAPGSSAYNPDIYVPRHGGD